MKYVKALFWVLYHRPFRYFLSKRGINLAYIVAQVSLRANYWSLKNPPKGKLRSDRTIFGHRYYYLTK